MSEKTGIEWTDATWNPVTGCTKVSQGCKFCYAEAIADRMWAKQYPPNPDGMPRRFTDVRMHPERLDQPLHWKKPRMIFVNSMSDLFHDEVTDKFLGICFAVMAKAYWHTFQVLTKRPERMADWSNAVMHYPKGDESKRPVFGWPPNVWLGVSVENQQAADERIPYMLKTPAAVRFISAEPLLDFISFWPWLSNPSLAVWYQRKLPMLDWIIVGGESGPNARPMNPDWARFIRDQCQEANVPFFMKQMGGWPDKLGKLDDIPLDLQIREYPD